MGLPEGSVFCKSIETGWDRGLKAGIYIQGRRRPSSEVRKRAASTLPDGVDQFPYSREMVIVVFGDKKQMVHEAHRRLQTRVGNGSSK
jgi:hypothetical protein